MVEAQDQPAGIDDRRNRLNILTWERSRSDIEDPSHQTRLRALEIAAGAHFAPDVYIAEKAEVHTERLSMGHASWIAGHAIVRGDIKLGDNVSVNPYACLSGRVTIGNDVRIASHVSIVGFNHGFDDLDTPIFRQPLTSKGIEIEDNVWIGANAVILDGVRIGTGSIVAAGAVVSQDIPPFSIAGGVPARVLKSRRPKPPSSRSLAEQRLLDLNAAAQRDWRSVIDHARSGDARRSPSSHLSPSAFSSPDASGRPVSTLRHLCDVIEISAAFGATDEAGDRSDLVTYLRSLQDEETGLFPEPGKPVGGPLAADPTALYNLLAVTYALECLGSAPQFPIRAVERLSAAELVAWLDGLPWQTRAWHSGATVDSIATGLSINARYFGGGDNRHALFGWLLAQCDRRTGLWGHETAKEGLLQPVNGFYRLTRGSYAQFGLALPYPEQAIDSVIRNYRDHDGFAGDHMTACNLLDTVHPLLLCLQQTSHRRSEAQSIAEDIILTLAPLWQAGRGLPFATGHPPGLQGTEMGLSLLWLAAKLAGLEQCLSYTPCGIHRFGPVHFPIAVG
ncbi:acyltransferase [Rhizobium sp. SSA_523]|uniref:acyltransferase n=1 Tax=Rhizobium sp. SSA_523 TaxID=2952477 RepID=UPI00209069C3|nr:acyltransferase [Rhizobium sp. SSA_523]MCO5732330.1 acyltransferase [Rhizobium sp. SSA_523]WKC21268.1 acyltransferase [Rhizobium sp. SSA_523]